MGLKWIPDGLEMSLRWALSVVGFCNGFDTFLELFLNMFEIGLKLTLSVAGL